MKLATFDYSAPELTTKEMRNHDSGSSRSRFSSKFLSRDTHDRLVFLSRIPAVFSLESQLASSNRYEIERLCGLGANARTANRVFARARCPGHGMDPYRRTGASFRSGARCLMDATGIGIPVFSRLPEGGRCLQQIAASAEDCTLSQGRVCHDARMPGFALFNLRPYR